MYGRAKRRSFFTSDENPGPGTYNIHSDRDYKEENVPFRFKVGHIPIWDTAKGPAPNSYTIKYRKHRIKGAAWSRMTEKKPFAQYDEKCEDTAKENERIHRTFTETKNSYFWLPDLENPRVWKGRPTKYFDKYKKLSNASSNIKDLNLRKYYIRTWEDTMKTCSGCEKYRGPFWSRYKAKRFPDKPSNLNPGPGEYDVEGERPSEESVWLDAIRFYKRATSKMERFTEKVECEAAVNDKPSPADTAFSPDIEKPKSFNVKGTFGNSKKQMSVIDEEGPSPLSYNPHLLRTPLVNRMKPPFNVTSERREQIPDLPGPASYNPPQGTIQFRLCKKLPPKTAKYVAPFNTTDIQRPVHVDKGIPDPAAYDVSVKPRRLPYGVKTTTFTLRRDGTRCRNKASLSPAHYDMVTAYDRLKKRCDRNQKRKPFNSSGPRLAPLPCDPDIPGPGTYVAKDDATKSGASAAITMRAPTTSKKDIHGTSNTPGPGSYTVHPLYNDSLVKAHCSHNVTLVPYPNFYPIKPFYGPPLPKTILKTFVKGG